MPSITVLAIQKGFQRGAENIFHRLHHGPKETSCLVDPGTEKDEYETVQHVTKRLMMSRQPMGVSEQNWSKVQKTQQQNCEAVLANRRTKELSAGISPGVGSAAGGTPSSTAFDIFSGSQELTSPLLSSRPMSSRSNNFSVAGQQPFSARTVSSQATRATTPGGVDPTMMLAGAGQNLGKMKGTPGDAPGDVFRTQVSPSSSAFQATPEEGFFWGGDAPCPLEEAQVQWPSQVVEGTSKIMALLERCDQVVKMQNELNNNANALAPLEDE